MAVYTLDDTTIETTLNGDISNSVLTIVVTDGSTHPSANYIILMEDEAIDIQSRTTNTLTVRSGGRGYSSTPAAAHSGSVSVHVVATSKDFFTRKTVGATTWEAQGQLIMGSNKITGLTAGTGAGEAVEFDAMETAIDTDITTHTAAQSAHHARYVDAEAAAKIALDDLYVKVTGDVMSGDLDMSGSFITDPGNPTLSSQVGDRGFNDLRYAELSGATFAGAVAMGNQVLSGPLDPTLGTHVGDRDYNDIRYLNTAGDTATGDLGHGLYADYYSNSGDGGSFRVRGGADLFDIYWSGGPNDSSRSTMRIFGNSNDYMDMWLDGDFDIDGTLDVTTGLILPLKGTTGDPTGVEGLIYVNTSDNKIRVYADAAWRDLATW